MDIRTFKYKRILLFILAFSMAMRFLVPLNAAYGATKGVCTANILMVRTGPGTDYPTVKVSGEDASLTKNQVVDILESKNGWYKVKAVFNNIEVEGYSLATYIKLEENASPNVARRGICTANTLMVRKGPGTNYDKVMVNDTEAYLTNGQSVEIISKEDEWYKIKAVFMGTTVEGYSSGTYIREVEDGPTPTAAPNATPTNATVPTSAPRSDIKATVSVPTSLNVRKYATTASELLGTLKPNDKVTILGQENNKDETWYNVQATINGKEVKGYVYSSYVALDVPVTAAVANNDTKVNTGVNVNTFVKDGGKYLLLGKNGLVTVTKDSLGEFGRWFSIRFVVNGKEYEGAVTADKLTFNLPAPTKAPTSAPTNVPTLAPTSGPTPTPTPLPELESNRGVVQNATYLVVRREAGYAGDILEDEGGSGIFLATNHPLYIHSYQVIDDLFWYEVTFEYRNDTYSGYINEWYILFLPRDGDPTPTPTPYIPDGLDDYERMLAEKGFPDSYRTYLVDLHITYPNWQFEPFLTGLSWNDVVNNESVPGLNLLPNSKGIAWKSLEDKAYNYKTDSFIVYDGSSWVTASRAAIAYYMDPRNFLNYNDIFQFEVLTYHPTYQNVEGVENILRNTILYDNVYNYVDQDNNKGTITYGQTFIKAAEYSNVSPYHLATRVKQEVVTGVSSISNSVTGNVPGFEGLYNFYNIGAYHSTVAGGAIANGLKYARNGSTNQELNTGSLIPWNNQYKSIVGGAYIIGRSYINRGQDTIYLQKFNVTTDSTYAHQYMANVEAPLAEGRKVNAAYGTGAYDLPLVFSIPVYLDMPSQLAEIPGQAYNPNNWLKSLQVFDTAGKELELSPRFDISLSQDYYLAVPANEEYINVTAASVSTKATVSGEGLFRLENDSNMVEVYVVAENGSIRTYRIIINKG